MTEFPIKFDSTFDDTIIPKPLGRLSVGDGSTIVRIAMHTDGTIHYYFKDVAKAYVHISPPTSEDGLYGFPTVKS